MHIVGHRGARGEYPENSLQGFLYCQQRGIKHVEYDLRLSRDLAAFIHHDETLQRTCGVDAIASTKTLAELQALTANVDSDTTKAATIPSLADVFTQCPEFSFSQLEVKSDYPDLIDRLVPEIIDNITKFERQKNTVITSFDTYVLKVSKRINRAISRGLLCEDAAMDAVSEALALGCDWVIWALPLLSKTKVEAAKQAGLKTSVFTVNKLEDMQFCHRLGIDSLITDYPSLALQHFAD